MKFNLLLQAFLGFSIILLTNCKPGTKNNDQQTKVTDTTNKTKDTIPVTNAFSTTDTSVIKGNEKEDPTLAVYLEYAHKEFDHLGSPFEAKYIGFSIGDYPHIIFRDKKGNEYDFGDGANSFGSFKEEDILNENSKYNNKMFKVTWEWKTSSFRCCDGDMDLKTAKVPSIVNMELVK